MHALFAPGLLPLVVLYFLGLFLWFLGCVFVVFLLSRSSDLLGGRGGAPSFYFYLFDFKKCPIYAAFSVLLGSFFILLFLASGCRSWALLSWVCFSIL